MNISVYAQFNCKNVPPNHPPGLRSWSINFGKKFPLSFSELCSAILSELALFHLNTETLSIDQINAELDVLRQRLAEARMVEETP